VRDAELYAKTLQIEHLKAQLAVLRRTRFGRSSEKLDREIEQLELLLGERREGVAESNARAEQAEQEARQPEARHAAGSQADRSQALPAHLPREQVTHSPQGACSCCGGTVLRKIGEGRDEVLEYVPSAFKVIQHVAAEAELPGCETIVHGAAAVVADRARPAGPGPSRARRRAKYADGLPLHRRAGSIP